jgi:hypothetical protein
VNWSNARKEITHVNLMVYVTLARRSHVCRGNARKEVTHVM